MTVGDVSAWGQPVGKEAVDGLDVEHLVALGCEVVAKQPTVTAPVEPLSAHQRQPTCAGRLPKLGDGGAELSREHVVGVVAEAGAAEAGVGRAFSGWAVTSAT